MGKQSGHPVMRPSQDEYIAIYGQTVRAGFGKYKTYLQVGAENLIRVGFRFELFVPDCKRKSVSLVWSISLRNVVNGETLTSRRRRRW